MLTPGSLVHYKEYVENPAFNQQRNVTSDNPRYIWRDAGQGYFHSFHPVSTHDDYSILAVIETEDHRLISCPIEQLTIANPATYATQVQANNKKLLEHRNICKRFLTSIRNRIDIPANIVEEVEKTLKELER